MTFRKELLAAEVHNIYCQQYKKRTGEEYWTKGDYSLLDEEIKDHDRVIVDWHKAEVRKILEELLKNEDNYLGSKVVYGESIRIKLKELE